MIWIVTSREILDNLMSLKFLLGTVLCLALVVIATIVSLQDYQTRMEEYDRTVAYFNENPGYSFVRIMRKPEVLSIFAHGFDKRLGNVATSNAAGGWTVPADAVLIGQEQMYRLTTGFASSLDLLFVIRVMVTLLAIFLSYDAISGEYERGTLKLTLSRPVPRSSIILGKLTAGAICLLVPLVTSFIIGFLIIHLVGGIGFTSEEWFRMASIFGVSVLCVMSFYMLGVVVSSRTRRAATSLLILLLIWIAGVLLVPGIATAAMGRYRLLSDHPGEDMSKIQSDLSERLREMRETPAPDPREDVEGRIRHMMKYNTKRQELVDQKDQTLWDMQRQYLDRLYSQADLVRWICRISPSESCAYAAEAMARTDVEAYRHFMRYARAYYKPHREFFREFEKESIRLFTDRDKRNKAIERANEEYGKAIESPPMGLSASFRAAAPDICLLIIFNVLFFMLSIMFFIRYDVH